MSAPTDETVRLGAFELQRPIGRGGMARVWGGHHRGTGLPVAVKVLTTRLARQPRFHSAFHEEVRAVAGLDHPAIVTVLDYGRVPPGVATERLPADAPYLVMERLGGSLRHIGAQPWWLLRQVASALLDALAHAHARGLVHRDLKPANVLWADQPGGALRLTDFGIAHALDRRRGRQRRRGPAAGTPKYMAPEQCQARWRDYGPWTDLYALGCLLYELASGAAPFRGMASKEVMKAHIRDPVAPLVPGHPLPTGFEGWLLRLLEKDPSRRFRRAADAAWALGQLPEPEAETAEDRALPAPGEVSIELELTPPSFGDASDTVLTTAVSGPGASSEALPDEGPRGQALPAPVWPPPPEDWREPDRAPRPTLFGAGLGLFGLRAVRLLGREEERDTLWAALRRVAGGGGPEAWVLTGLAGCGKSRLAEWLCRRAHQLGAASVLVARHGAGAGPGEGLEAMMIRELGCADLDREQTAVRAARRLADMGVNDRAEWAALTELVCPAGAAAEARQLPESLRVVQLGDLTERHLVIARYLRALSAERPVIVCLDDVQWAPDAPRFTHDFLASASHEPVLFLLTAAEELLAERPTEASRLAELRRHEAVRHLPLGPLGDDTHLALVRSLLGLEPSLAARVARRTGGNPLFAVQLIGDWVQRGALRAGPDGFGLGEDEGEALPDDIHAVWESRIEALLGDAATADDRPALWVAAALGASVRSLEWSEACAKLGHAPSPSLEERLLRLRLARPLPDAPGEGWRFVHGMLRESLQRQSREASAEASCHRACAAMLAARPPEPGSAARIGRHLLAAGDHAEAPRHLAAGFREHFGAGDLSGAEGVLKDWWRALEALGPGPEDPRTGQGWLMASRLALAAGEFEEAKAEARQAIELAETFGWHEVAVEGLLVAAKAAIQTQPAAADLILLERAQALVSQLDSPRRGWLEGECWRLMGAHHQIGGRSEEARRCFLAAQAIYEAIGERQEAVLLLIHRAELAKQAGQLDQAARLGEAAVSAFERHGSRRDEATTRNLLGDLARLGGDLERAERHYRRAYQLCEATGAPNAAFAGLNLALVLQARGEWRAAAAELGALLEEARRRDTQAVEAVVHVFLMACAAALEDWSAFDGHAQQGASMMAGLAWFDVDLAQGAQRAAELCDAAEQLARGRRAWRIAHAQWTGLERSDEAARAAARLT